jgi:uncharacterized protein YciI
MDKGILVVFGPVFDQPGVYGLSVVEVAHMDEVAEIIKGDPPVPSILLNIIR